MWIRDTGTTRSTLLTLSTTCPQLSAQQFGIGFAFGYPCTDFSYARGTSGTIPVGGGVVSLGPFINDTLGHGTDGAPSETLQHWFDWRAQNDPEWDKLAAQFIHDVAEGGPHLSELILAANDQLGRIIRQVSKDFEERNDTKLLRTMWLAQRVSLWILEHYLLGSNILWKTWVGIFIDRFKTLPPNVGKDINDIHIDLKGVHTWMDQVGPWILKIPSLVTLVNTHQSQLTQIRTVDLPRIYKYQADNTLFLNTQVVPKLALLRHDLDSLNTYTRTTLTVRVDTAFKSIADIKKFVDLTVWPRVQKNTTDISVIFGQIVGLDMKKINKALLDLNNLQVLVIPQIQGNVKRAQDDINAIGKPLPVQKTLQSLSQRITADEVLKTQTIIPSIQRLVEAVQGLQKVNQDLVLPTLGRLVQDVATLWQTIRDGILPHLTKLDSSITTITTTITNIITPQLKTFQTFITNINTTVINIVKTNCAQILACLDAEKKKDPTLACEEGRSWWGVWAECWLNAHTPAPDLPIMLPAEDYDPLAIIASIGDATDLEGPSRTARILLDTLLFLGTASEDQVNPPLAFLDATDNSQFGFQAEP